MPTVTVATCTTVFEAEILRGYLRSEGIKSRLRDAEIVTADWTMSVAVGGVKVEVHPIDADRAGVLLTEPADPFPDDEPHTAAEVASWRALTGALVPTPMALGLLFGVTNVARVLATATRETPRTWRRTLWAALVLLIWLCTFFLLGGLV